MRNRLVLMMWTAGDRPTLSPCHTPAVGSWGCWFLRTSGAPWLPASLPIPICSSRSHHLASPWHRWRKRRLFAHGAGSGV